MNSETKELESVWPHFPFPWVFCSRSFAVVDAQRADVISFLVCSRHEQNFFFLSYHCREIRTVTLSSPPTRLRRFFVCLEFHHRCCGGCETFIEQVIYRDFEALQRNVRQVRQKRGKYLTLLFVDSEWQYVCRTRKTRTQGRFACFVTSIFF